MFLTIEILQEEESLFELLKDRLDVKSLPCSVIPLVNRVYNNQRALIRPLRVHLSYIPKQWIIIVTHNILIRVKVTVKTKELGEESCGVDEVFDLCVLKDLVHMKKHEEQAVTANASFVWDVEFSLSKQSLQDEHHRA